MFKEIKWYLYDSERTQSKDQVGPSRRVMRNVDLDDISVITEIKKNIKANKKGQLSWVR